MKRTDFVSIAVQTYEMSVPLLGHFLVNDRNSSTAVRILIIFDMFQKCSMRV